MASALTIPGYEISSLIHEGLNTIVLLGVSQAKQEKVILKVLKAEYPSLEQISRLKYEYSITENIDLEGVVKALRLETYQNRLVLVLQDFGGKSLKKFIKEEKLSLVSFLSIAVQIAKALVSLHAHQIIHKDIKPNNIIFNPQTGVCKITDFSIASRLDKETLQPIAANRLEGTLAYISPEQTGRMNRAVDYRSDFYSLGVTFYEMLSGKFPFETDDSLELIHCHLAKEPLCIQTLNPEIPPVLAAIIHKLMAKNASDRYQSAAGLLADLQLCLDKLKTTGKISDFLPAEKDRVSQLNMTQKLYGREEEIKTLFSAFVRVASVEEKLVAGNKCRSEIILVSGYSGIGKSSLVCELHKPIVRQRGYFIAGKFDQLGRNIPYASIIQAFKSLIQQLLTENATQLQKWQSKLILALGTNAQVIIDVIPEVELIIGKQPEVAQLGAIESQNRFHRVFQQFIQVFCQKEHPLVLFIDDLQWADSASLNLLQVLMTNPESQYLLLIGAYRDNEVSVAHPLMKTLEEIENAGTVINNIVLRPLAKNDVGQILADTFVETRSITSLEELTELLFNKTQGNPFFLTQLLKSLHQEKLLQFDFSQGCWFWNIQDIQATGIAEKSVVDLIAGTIEKLPSATQRILKLAACIGARFSLDVLITVSEQQLLEVAHGLEFALQQGLILPLSHEYRIPLLFSDKELESLKFDKSRVQYRFLHDRVQQAAYSLIPEEDKQETHLKIGQLLLNNTPQSEIEANIFDIVNQLNAGIDTLAQQSQNYELAKLNLIAGRKAKAAAAYEGALNYLNAGIKILNQNCWQNDYDLSLALYVEATEVAYFSGNIEQMEILNEIVLQEAKVLLDKIKVYEVKIFASVAQQKIHDAIEVGLQTLELLGVSFPKEPTDADVGEAMAKIASPIASKGIEELINLPLMTDDRALAAMQVSNSIATATYLAEPRLFLLIVLAQVNLSIEYGNAPLSAFAYAAYGIVISGVMNDIESGCQFGNLALNLSAKFGDKLINTRVLLTVAACIMHWKSHLRSTLPLFQLGYQSGLETGNLTDTAYHCYYECQASYFMGQELGLLSNKIKIYNQAILQLKQELPLNHNQMLQQVVNDLMGCELTEAFDEIKALQKYQELNDLMGLYYFHLHKIILGYLFDNDSQALENANLAANYLAGVTGQSGLIHFYFYDSLVRINVYANADETEQKFLLDKVIANQEKMQLWVHHAPMNFQHKYDLIEAEKYCILGNVYQAIDFYDRAIAGAAENLYLQEEALANERAALFYLSLGKHKIAKTYMTDAYYCYTRWGAIAKVKDLEKRYPNLIISCANATQIPEDKQKRIVTTISSTIASSSDSSQIFDLATIIKVSEAIQSEINLENLPSKLLSTIIENAGAQKGCLILEKDKQLFIEAIDTGEPSGRVVMQPTPVETSEKIPISIINYVAITKSAIVLKDASLDSIYYRDAYIQMHQSKSILCIPVFYQTQFIGIFYLENNLITDAFTPARLELIKILASQAAIALKNARLLASEQEKLELLQKSESDLKQKSADLEQALTKLQNTQSQLIQTEKISALGQMVAGVAHEVNNPVSYISGNLSHVKQYVQDLVGLVNLYQAKYPNPSVEITDEIENIDLEYLINDLPKMLDSMKMGTDRIKDIMQSLRNYSRTDVNQKKEFNIHDGINSTLIILSHRLKAKPQRPAIEVIKKYGDLPLIHCFPGQLNQVFTNIIANAIDAMDEYNAGKNYAEMEQNPSKIVISTYVDESQVKISITDNGPGMTAEIRDKIFNAFFTTKAEGKGTGLGLSISYEIITEKHQGNLQCFSEVGKGTEFLITLTPYATSLR